MEVTNNAESAEVTGLKDALGQVAVKELSDETFATLSATAYATRDSAWQISEALSDWGSVAAAFPAKSDSEIVAGYLEFARGDLEAALARLRSQKATEWGGCLYARVLSELGRPDKALKMARATHQKHPDSLPAAYSLARALCASRLEEEARELVDSLGERDGATSRWVFHDALVKEVEGEYRAAIDGYREAASRDDEHTEAWFRLALLLDVHGTPEEEEKDEAVLAYEACLKANPVPVNAVMNLGLIYEDRERYHDAIKCYESVLRAHPNHPRARLYLGDAIAATSMFYDRDQEKKADRHSQVLKIPVTDFELSVRSRNCLQKMNIDTLGDLIMKTEQELLSYKNFGETSLKEIKDMLSQKALRLGQGLEDQGREPPSGRNPLEATVSADILDRPIDDLELSVRSRRCMDRLEVVTIRDLINKTEVELMSAKNFGMTSLNEIKRKLAELKLALRS